MVRNDNMSIKSESISSINGLDYHTTDHTLNCLRTLRVNYMMYTQFQIF